MRQYSFLAVFLLLLGIMVGCSQTTENGGVISPTEPPTQPVNPPVKQEVKKEAPLDLSLQPANLGQVDQAFVEEVRSSSQTASLVMKNVEQKIADAEENDEMDEVGDIVKSAKQDILYIWNKTHNQIHPEDKTLQQLKERYEAILMNYYEGLSTEWQGMESGDPITMKQGYTQTEQARANFEQLYVQIKNLPK